MAADTIIEEGGDIYYVDKNGARAANRWVSRPNENSECEQDVDVLWYYFGKNGKAYTEEGKSLKLMEGSAEYKYFFDSDGHMLSGWQKITKKGDDNDSIYYLGTENQGHIHRFWQYLEPDEEVLDLSGHDYDALEMFYFGWDGKMTRSEESKLEGEHFLFDENGVMLKGWAPGITADDPDFALNRFYDEETGIRAKGWLYASDPDDEDGDPHWFYCDDNTGLIFNEGGKDSDDSLGCKTVDGKTYFFDSRGHMITGLISTDGTDVSDSPFAEEEFSCLSGDIGKGAGARPAGIYYLSQEEGTLGQLQKGKRLNLKDSYETFCYELDTRGRAYENALRKGCIYGQDGSMIHSDSGWQVMTMDQDIYDQDDYYHGELKDSAVPKIGSGDQVIVNKSGKVKRSGSIEIDNRVYRVENYVVVSEE